MRLAVRFISISADCAPAGEKDRGRWIWRDLRGLGSVEPGQCGVEGGVRPATQTGSKDGGGGAEKAAG